MWPAISTVRCSSARRRVPTATLPLAKTAQTQESRPLSVCRKFGLHYEARRRLEAPLEPESYHRCVSGACPASLSFVSPDSRRLPQSILPMQLSLQQCAPIRDTFLLHNQKCLYHHPRTACGSRRSLAVVPLIGDQRYYGETPMRLRRDCRPIRGNGPGGWRWVSGRRLAFWMSQPGLELPTETRATGQGARPRRSLASDSTGRQSLPRA